MLQFILVLALDSFPHSDIPKTRPSIISVILQRFDAQTSKFLRDFGFDSAVTDFPVIAPGFVGKVFAEHSPSGIVVAHIIVQTNKLIRTRRSLSGTASLSRLKGHLRW